MYLRCNKLDEAPGPSVSTFVINTESFGSSNLMYCEILKLMEDLMMVGRVTSLPVLMHEAVTELN